MEHIKIKEKKRLNKLLRQYTKLVSTNTYKGQYVLIKQIKPLVKRIKAQADEVLDKIEENERIRKSGIKRETWSKSTNTIGSYQIRKIKQPK